MVKLTDEVCLEYLNKYKQKGDDISNYAFALCDPTWKELFKKTFLPNLGATAIGGTVAGGIVIVGITLQEMGKSMFVVSATKKGILMVMVNYLSKDIGSVFIPYKDIKFFEAKRGIFLIVIKLYTITGEKPLIMKFNKVVFPIKKQKQNALEIIRLLEFNVSKN